MAEVEPQGVSQTIKSWVSGWVSSRFFERRAYRKTSNGASSMGLPILLNGSGKLDSSFYGLVQVTDANFTLVDNVDATKKFQLQLSSIATATTRTWTVPNFSDTLVGLAGSQTLTNKTLTTPVIGDFTNATHNHSNAAGGGSLGAVSATSVNFGGTALANYLEGTWAATIQGSVSNPSTLTFSTQSATYTRIGRAFFCTFVLAISSIIGGSGDVRVTLPSTVGSSTSSGGIGNAYLSGVDLPGTVVAVTVNAANSQSYATIQALQDNGAAGPAQISGLSNGDVVAGTVIYFV